MKSRAARHRFALVAACAHIAVCVLFYLTLAHSEWGWFPIFALDFPASIMAMYIPGIDQAVSLLAIGTLWWYAIGSFIGAVRNSVQRPPPRK